MAKPTFFSYFQFFYCGYTRGVFLETQRTYNEL